MKTKFHKNYKEVRKLIQKMAGQKSSVKHLRETIENYCVDSFKRNIEINE